MAQNKVYRFKDLNEAMLFLNGAVIGKAIPLNGIQGLVGRKIKFTLPAAVEHTFVTGGGTDPYTLSLDDIKTQLEAAVAGLKVRTFEGKLVLQESTPSGGVVIIAATSAEARALLGLDPANTITSKVFRPVSINVAPPCWIALQVDDNNYHTIYTWE